MINANTSEGRVLMLKMGMDERMIGAFWIIQNGYKFVKCNDECNWIGYYNLINVLNEKMMTEGLIDDRKMIRGEDRNVRK